MEKIIIILAKGFQLIAAIGIVLFCVYNLIREIVEFDCRIVPIVACLAMIVLGLVLINLTVKNNKEE